jgi:hypothetical protein
MPDDAVTLDRIAGLDRDAHLAGPASIWSRLFSMTPLERVRNIDAIMEEHRQSMAYLASLRDNAVRELAGATSVIQAAKALGVTRQAIYRTLQENRSFRESECTNTVFLDERIELDGRVFKGCTFYRCTLVYAATAPITLMNCAMEDCQWVLEGPAALALDFMSALYANGDEGSQRIVEETFRSIMASREAVTKKPE